MGHGFRNKIDGTRNSLFGCPVTEKRQGYACGYRHVLVVIC